ncbi:unnamed protein product [Rotaria magnacalcarata]|uniref:Uncharacterized protein n=1 Tax=Rotaria magnacalcarata TaxID=392030 RepID=A0A816GKS4_9BILA|nr:unnamed protein product [Rotaria magnacalcarata]CAF1675722.1 unnamed protein product [Rotaria magnacalcarata]CAF1932155.1 unnamed protein product [Rotaria magnacalcarata]CAF3956627.1 unnamed protein product [Rotaria magnacalcarata]
MYESTKNSFKVPLEVPGVKTKVNITDYEVSLSHTPFAILVKRKSTGVTISFLYGLGEHQQSLLIDITNKWKQLTF